jgi:hypothetical protein
MLHHYSGRCNYPQPWLTLPQCSSDLVGWHGDIVSEKHQNQITMVSALATMMMVTAQILSHVRMTKYIDIILSSHAIVFGRSTGLLILLCLKSS